MDLELMDADLVRQFGSGRNREAEAELFRRMAPRIRLYGLRHLRDEHASEDLTRQVLITTLEALRAGRLREPGKLASFDLGACSTVWRGSTATGRAVQAKPGPAIYRI